MSIIDFYIFCGLVTYNVFFIINLINGIKVLDYCPIYRNTKLLILKDIFDRCVTYGLFWPIVWYKIIKYRNKKWINILYFCPRSYTYGSIYNDQKLNFIFIIIKHCDGLYS